MFTVYLGIGTNLGHREANFIQAIKALQTQIDIELVSSVYETEPAYITEQASFYNAVLRGKTKLDPFELLHFAKGVEKDMGRITSQRYGPRLIDIDILIYENLEITDKHLTIPHHRMFERAFVLIPFAEIAPDFIPVGQTQRIAEWAKQLDESSYGAIMRIVENFRVVGQM